jgi:hypothetical protein
MLFQYVIQPILSPILYRLAFVGVGDELGVGDGLGAGDELGAGAGATDADELTPLPNEVESQLLNKNSRAPATII